MFPVKEMAILILITLKGLRYFYVDSAENIAKKHLHSSSLYHDYSTHQLHQL